MSETLKPVRVAVNVMRARLTVIGFNIAIVSFQITQLYRTSGGLRVPGIDHAVHVEADMALFMALALSIIALVAFIMSSEYDEVGVCTHWSLVAGDLLMYLALAHTVAASSSRGMRPLAYSLQNFRSRQRRSLPSMQQWQSPGGRHGFWRPTPDRWLRWFDPLFSVTPTSPSVLGTWCCCLCSHMLTPRRYAWKQPAPVTYPD